MNFSEFFSGILVGALSTFLATFADKKISDRANKTEGVAKAKDTILDLERDLLEILDESERCSEYDGHKNLELEIRTVISVAENSKSSIYDFASPEWKRWYESLMKLSYHYRDWIYPTLLDHKKNASYDAVVYHKETAKIRTRYETARAKRRPSELDSCSKPEHETLRSV
jgi:hypothetical protein